KELTRASTAIDRYLQAFEDGDLDPTTVKHRMKTLSDKITQLTDRRDELAVLLSVAPTVPPAIVLDELTDHIADIIRSGSPAQRKALIETLVAEVKITGPNTIIPVFRIPQLPAAHAAPENAKVVAAPPATTASGRMVRTMVEPVEVLAAYSHSIQAADLRLCHTVALTSPARTPGPTATRHGACAIASPNATSPS
ncbi:MAG: recombinase family protein, partial [Frankiales bacterium]|nr:recombinase family protein [Frankiales bacterium]